MHARDEDMARSWLTCAHFAVGLLGMMHQRRLDMPEVTAVTESGVDTPTSTIRAGAHNFVVKPAGALHLEVRWATPWLWAGPNNGISHLPFPASCRTGRGCKATGTDGGRTDSACVRSVSGPPDREALRLGISRFTLNRKLTRIPATLEDNRETSPALPRFTPEIVAAE